MQQITLDEAYYNRAVANYFLGNFHEALKDCNESLQINSNNTKTLIARGIVYSALGIIEDAINNYNRALKINPNSYHAYFNRAVAYSMIGDENKAISDYSRALHINLYKADAYYNRGNSRYALGDEHGAIADYNIAVEINPDKADAYYNRGEIRYELGDKFNAIEDFKKAAEIYKHKGQEIDYQDAIEKIKSFYQSERREEDRENKNEINFHQNYVSYSFDVFVQHQDMWEQLLKDIKCSWQIVSRKNKKFIRIRFYGTDEKFLILSQNLAEYKEYHLKDIKSDFDTHINNEAIQAESLIDNTAQEFDKIGDNNYPVQFERDNCDSWLDCGYMNDIINPYEVY
jgi:tetratricopeptide (TPR) repeat protein